MKIKILGAGCTRCESLEKLTRKAVEEMHLDATVEKIENIEEILKYSVMRTPAIVINEKVIFSGKVPDLSDLKSLFYNISVQE